MLQLESSKAPSQGYARIDSSERVTGLARYATDWKIPNMLYARIITSEIAHGTVRSIDRSRALSLDGVKSVITCLDDNTRWRAGEREHERRVFTDHVRFVGDCVGALAATTRKIAEEAVELVEVTYDELPAVFTIAEALNPNAGKIWENGNVIGPMKYGFGNIEDCFTRADLIIEGEYTTPKMNNMPLEPAASLAWWDGDRLTVVAGTQSLYGCRQGLSTDLGLPPENVRVICLYKGGGFGNRNSDMNYDLIAALLARKTARPVMLEYSRKEDFVSVHGRWSTNQRLRAAVRQDGKLLGVKLKAHCDIGAYTRHVKPPEGGMFTDRAENYYSCEVWSGEIFGVYTNTPPTGHMRAPVDLQACFASETLADEAANALHMDPLEFRMRNAVERYHESESLTSNGLKECLIVGSKIFGWREKWHPPTSTKSYGKLRGVGVAMASHHALVGRGEATIRIKKDGIVEVYVGVVDIGTGAKTAMALIAANTLGVNLRDMKVISGDTATCPYSVGESAARTTSCTGSAVKEAAKRLKARVLALASSKMGTNEQELDITAGQIFAKRNPASRNKLIEVINGDLEESVESNLKLPSGTRRYSFSAHFAEVEVDAETGQVRVIMCVSANDCGPVVNRLTAESQVRGGVVMGISVALCEEVMIDDKSGLVQNPSLWTYRVAGHTMIPPIEVHFVETQDPLGPKTVGEVGLIPVAPAIGNAIFNATGARLRRIPMKAPMVREVILKS